MSYSIKLYMDEHIPSSVTHTSYAVGYAKGIFASGRAEDPSLFHKNVALRATFL